jgi:hypothetical protein
MKKAVSVNKKSRGRPKKKGGSYPVSAVRLSPEVGAAVDDWAALNEIVGRSEAIRRLVEIGLGRPAKPPVLSRKFSVLAKELAAKAIDGLVDKSAPTEEQRLAPALEISVHKDLTSPARQPGLIHCCETKRLLSRANAPPELRGCPSPLAARESGLSNP